MKKIISSMFVVIMGAAAAACSGSEGAPGPAGATGTAGEPGSRGPAGEKADPAPTPTPATDAPKAVYTLSNDASENAVFVYARKADGSLSPSGAYATGGKGAAAGLGDQGALVYDASQKAFFAINAGDDSISMLSLREDGSLSLVSKIGAGGVKPVSITVSGKIVYVVNAGDASHGACISGFRIGDAGLSHIDGSTQPLSAASTAPAQIQFTPDGSALVVTEKATDKILTYAVTDGLASAPAIRPSAGQTPFGFAFGANGHLLVSEAFGGADGLGAASSYVVGGSALTARSTSVGSTQSAPCWVAVAGDRAFVTNTKSNTISAYDVAADGKLTLTGGKAIAAETGASPIDAAVTVEKDILYVLDAKDHALGIYAIGAGGDLARKPDFVGVPEFAIGLVAR